MKETKLAKEVAILISSVRQDPAWVGETLERLAFGKVLPIFVGVRPSDDVYENLLNLADLEPGVHVVKVKSRLMDEQQLVKAAAAKGYKSYLLVNAHVPADGLLLTDTFLMSSEEALTCVL